MSEPVAKRDGYRYLIASLFLLLIGQQFQIYSLEKKLDSIDAQWLHVEEQIGKLAENGKTTAQLISDVTEVVKGMFLERRALR